jgi:hypothetical protein
MEGLKLDQWWEFLVDRLLVDMTMDIKSSINHMAKLCALLIRFDGDVILARKCIQVVKWVNNRRNKKATNELFSLVVIWRAKRPQCGYHIFNKYISISLGTTECKLGSFFDIKNNFAVFVRWVEKMVSLPFFSILTWKRRT